MREKRGEKGSNGFCFVTTGKRVTKEKEGEGKGKSRE